MSSPATIYYRIIAFWVVCESVLGGIIHGLHLPVSGLIVGSCSILCITLIAVHEKSKGAILKATMIVLLFKFMLSPQSPPTAYIAVLFQGLIGQLLIGKEISKTKVISFSMLTMAESALQRLLVMLIFFGTEFWKAMDQYAASVVHVENLAFSQWLAVAYIIVHIIIGAVVGFYCYRFAQKSKAPEKYFPHLLLNENMEEEIEKAKPEPGRRKIIRIFLLIILYACTFYFGEGHYWQMIAKTILRMVVLIFLWQWLVIPVFRIVFAKFFADRKIRYQQLFDAVAKDLPAIQTIMRKCWKNAKGKNIFQRIMIFISMSAVNTLANNER